MNSMNPTPFISAQLHSENDCVPAMAGVPAGAADSAPLVTDELENMYPEIYRELFPLVLETVDKMAQESYTPTPEAVGAIVDNIIRNSGLWYEDDDSYDLNGEAIPVQFRSGSMPFQRRRRRHHNRDTLRDIIRILLLREILTRQQGYPYRYY